MKVKIKKRDQINIADSGALSDLAFLLIIFFIVIAVFNINKGFMLGLPQKQSTKVVNVKDIIKVTLTENNELMFEDAVISLDDVKTLVEERLKVRPNMTFLLKIHPEATYQEVVSVVTVVQKMDVDNFSFSMLEE